MSSGPHRWRSPSKADGNYSPEEQSGAKAIYTSALAKWRHLRFQKVGFHCCAIHSRLPNARGGGASCEVPPWGLLERVSPAQPVYRRARMCLLLSESVCSSVCTPSTQASCRLVLRHRRTWMEDHPTPTPIPPPPAKPTPVLEEPEGSGSAHSPRHVCCHCPGTLSWSPPPPPLHLDRGKRASVIWREGCRAGGLAKEQALPQGLRAHEDRSHMCSARS